MSMPKDYTGASISLGSVLCTDELDRRQSRKPDRAAEADALAMLADKLVQAPEETLQCIAECAVRLCGIDATGIVLVHENDIENAQEVAAAGAAKLKLKPQGSPPSPFTVALERAAPQLFCRPQRHFSYLRTLKPPIEEMLAVPFTIDGSDGVIWGVSCTASRAFDAEDLRLLTNLGRFAASACRALELMTQSERRRNSMRELEERLRLKLGTGRFGRWRLDLDSMELSAADQCKANLGHAPGKPVSLPMLCAAIHADDYPPLERTLRSAIDNGNDYEADFRITWPDASTHWLAIRGMVVYEQYRAVRLEGVSRDITARKFAEEAQQASQRRLQHTLDMVGLGTFVWDLIENRMEGDARLLELFGIERTSSADLRSAMRTAIHPQDRARHDAAVAQALDPHGPGTLREELRLDGPEGDERWLSILAYAEFAGVSDHATQMNGMVLDISERKRAEIQLRTNERRQAYLLKLSDALRSLTGAEEIQAAATRVLGEQLGAMHVLYAEIEDDSEGEHYLVRQDYSAHGETSFAGRHRAADVGSTLISELRAGRTLVVADVAADTRFTERERSARLSGGVQAYVVTPLIKHERLVAFLAAFRSLPQAWSADDIALIEETAERTWAAVERGQAEAALRISEARLAAELRETKLLQNISAELIQEDDVNVLHDKILSAAMNLLRADFATLQMWSDGAEGKLRLLASRGADAQSAEWVRATSDTACRIALRSHRRVVVPNVETCDFMVGTVDLARFLEAGVRALQTTPLVSRDGKLVGMLSTHWQTVHAPTDNELAMLDILTRQAADLIDRTCAAAAVRENEQRFRMLADNMSQLAWTCDRLGEVTWYNKRWYEYTGLTFEQLRDWGWQAVQHPDHLERVLASIARSQETGEPWEETFPLRRHDGVYRWFLSRAVPIRDEPGAIVRWFGTNTDITEQREAEHALQEADKRKNEFIAILAHELRNPLAPVKNALEILKRLSADNKTIESTTAILDRQVGQLTRLVDDLLDIHRITRGKIELRRAKNDLRPIVSQAAEMIRPMCENRRQDLVIELPPYPVYVDADTARFAQIVGNLLNNASKFTDRGGQIKLVLENKDDQAQIRVEDNGIGIAQDQLSKIFELFAQGDSSPESVQAGLGIGLTLVRRLVEMHGGSVEARSSGHGRGAEFLVRLPLVSSAAVTEKSATHAAEALTPKRFLVVDDNQDSALSLEQLLTLYGHEVHTAFDGVEAIEAAARWRPDVILLDLDLPKLSGFDAARRIREQHVRPRPIIVAVTGWGQDEDRRAATAAGIDGHVVKPVDPAGLLKLIADLLKDRPLVSQIRLVSSSPDAPG
jgi:PAS domain S-box-containing protein